MSNPEDSDLELEVAHVLLIDVVGYSKLLVDGQIEVLEQLNRVVRETAHFRSAEAEGKLTRLPTGDGMALLFFDSAETPLQCALEISRAAKAYPLMQLRMGAHTGPIKEVMDVNNRPNFAGAGINIAQRVLDCGDAGHILVSERIAEDLRLYRQWHSSLHDLGMCEVKHGVQLHIFNLCRDGLGNPAVPSRIKSQHGTWRNMRRALTRNLAGSPWRKTALGGSVALIAAAIVWSAAQRSHATPEKSIAVLPFANLSDERSNAYFVDGVQDEILTDLSKVEDLKVISRASVMQFKAGAERNLPAIARALHVSHVLEGSVQKVNNRVRVHAQLVDGATGVHLWADHYDGELADVLGIQSAIAKQIVAQLKVRLSPEVQAAIEKPPTNDFAAYDLYVRAKGLIYESIYSLRGMDDLNEAVQLLTQAVARDPSFFLGSYQLAQAHDQLWHRFDPSPARLALAETSIATLRRLRPDAAETHLATARHIYWVNRDTVGARAELEIAQRMLPNESEVPLLIGYIDRRESRWDDSIRSLQSALTLDPQNITILHQLSLTFWMLRRYPEMAEALDRALTIDPNNLPFRMTRAQVELEWKADTKPLHELFESKAQSDPSGAATIADVWLDLALMERDSSSATRALFFLGEEGCPVEWIPFSRGWCEGMAARSRGDNEGARAGFTKARTVAEELIRAQPRNGGAACVLGMANAALGNKEEAIRWGQRAVELWPISKDSINGALIVGYLGVIYAWLGEKDLAIEQIEKATSVPSYWTYGNLRLHPYWDPVRDDPRFQKILESVAPK